MIVKRIEGNEVHGHNGRVFLAWLVVPSSSNSELKVLAGFYELIKDRTSIRTDVVRVRSILD